MAQAMSYTTQGTTWNVISDGSLNLFGEDSKNVGDLGQTYVDVSDVSYSFYNGSLFFRFSLRGEIPNRLVRKYTNPMVQIMRIIQAWNIAGLRLGEISLRLHLLLCP